MPESQGVLSRPSVPSRPMASLFGSLIGDLLILIFKYGHEGHNVAFSRVVSSICRHWRHVALDLPSLWSPITFHFPKEYTSPVKTASLYLQRTKPFPMELTVVVDKIFVAAEQSRVVEEQIIEEQIIPHLWHCRTLSIQGSSDHLLSHILRITSKPIPMLETLELVGTEGKKVEDRVLESWKMRSQMALFDTRTLRTLRVYTIPFDWTEPSLLFRLDLVTNFTLHWDFHDPPFGRMVHHRLNDLVVAMPTLKLLQLSCTYLAELSRPLSFKKLPSTLDTLALKNIPVTCNMESDGSSQLIFPSLQRLHLVNDFPMMVVNSNFFTQLSLQPSLKELYMAGVEFLPGAVGITGPIQLSHLTHLKLEYWEANFIDSFVKNVSTPALIYGNFTVATHPLPPPLDSFPPVRIIPRLWRSCPRLQDIVLSSGCTLDRTCDLLGALKILRDVKRLDLQGRIYQGWDDELLIALGTPPWICPSLEEISLSGLALPTQGALEFFISARLDGCKAGQCMAIKVVKIRGCGKLTNTLTLEGMVLEVRHWK